MAETAEYCRDFAKRCREMERHAYADSTRQTLREIAEEYDRKAEALERAVPDG